MNSLIQGRKLLPLSDLRGLHSMKELPKKIGNLIHLKWLSLRGGGITRLPKSMGKLFNLLILDMRDSLLKGYPIQFEYCMNRNIYMVIKSWFWAFFSGCWPASKPSNFRYKVGWLFKGRWFRKTENTARSNVKSGKVTKLEDP